MPVTSNDFVSNIVVTLKAALITSGIDDELAEQAAKTAVDSLIFNLGGIQLYIPKLTGIRRSRRDSKIISEFTGSNHNELCMKYDLSIQRIYKILKEYNKQESTS